MRRIIISLSLFFCSFYSLSSFSGSPGGLYLLVVPMSSGLEFKENIDHYFKKYYGVDNELSPECEINIGKYKSKMKTSVDVFYLNTKPQSINEHLLTESLNNGTSVTKLRNLLVKYKDDNVSGFDAVLFYESVNGSINFYALSSLDKKSGIIKSSILTSSIVNDSKLGQALCMVIVNLPTPAP
jgi:hypothetical protein